MNKTMSARWRFMKRIRNDIQQAKDSTDYQFIPAETSSDDTSEYYMIINVLEGLYAGQTHVVHMKLIYGSEPDIYFFPKDPPLCTMKTPIWHPNIDVANSGIICVDTLKPFSEENEAGWTPKMTLDSIYSVINLLLLEPNANSPQNLAAGKDYIQYVNELKDNKQSTFPQIVKSYYNNGGPEIVEKIKQLAC